MDKNKMDYELKILQGNNKVEQEQSNLDKELEIEKQNIK